MSKAVHLWPIYVVRVNVPPELEGKSDKELIEWAEEIADLHSIDIGASPLVEFAEWTEACEMYQVVMFDEEGDAVQNPWYKPDGETPLK